MYLLNIALASFVTLVPAQEAAALSDLPQSDEPVSVRVVVQPLSRTLETLSEETGVRLSAERGIAGDLVTLVCKDQPRREVLLLLAEHFGWTWRKTGEGYRLVKTSQQARAEEQAAMRQFAAPLLAGQRFLLQELEASNALDIREAFDRAAEVKLAAIETDDEAARRRLERQAYRLDLRYNVFNRLAILAFSSLGEQEAARARWLGVAVFSSRATPSQFPFSQEALRAARTVLDSLRWAAGAEGATPNPSDLPPQISVWLSDAIRDERRLAAANPAALLVRVTLIIFSAERGADPIGWGYVDVVDSDGLLLARSRDVVLPGPPPSADMQRERPPELDVPIERSPLLQYVATRLAPEEGLDLGRFWRKGSDADPLEDLGRVLSEISDLTGVPVIADAHDQLGEGVPRANGAKTCLDVLDALQRWKGWNWSYQGGWLRLRVRDWESAQLGTVERESLMRLRESFFEDGGIGLDQIATTLLPPASPVGGPARTFGFYIPAFMGGPFAKERLLRFWSVLPPSLRMVLAQGEKVRYGDLPLQARAAFDDLLYSQPSGGPLFGGYSLEDRRSEFLERLSEAWPWRERISDYLAGYRDDEITQLRPVSAAPDDTVSLVMGEYPGVLVFAEDGRLSCWDVSRLAGVLSSLADFFGFRARYLPATITEHAFLVEAAGQTRYFGIATYRFDPGAEPKAWADLPSDLREKIAEAERRRRDGTLPRGAG